VRYAIETHNLRKVFGDVVAVSDLSLTVEPGEVFGFLGPNGAGKTTSVKMLLGLIKPTSGQGWLLDSPLDTPQSRAPVGFLPEHFRFHDWLTATEFLKVHADLYRIPRQIAQERIPNLLERVGLASRASQQLRTFSKGMLQRIGLAQALLNEPRLILLDEPTSGLDPIGCRIVRDIIRDLREQGTTVFLNSHLLSEVEVTCDRVAFIKDGEVVHVSALQTLVEGEVMVEIRARPLDNNIVAGLSQWGSDVSIADDLISLTLSSEGDLPKINRYLVAQGVDVYTLHPRRISLEDLFAQVIEVNGEHDGNQSHCASDLL
jgi:ABC-2 type transport system ATP-binding protein